MAKPNKRQKLCHNCEAEIDLDVIVCPFCAADLREERPIRETVSPLKAILKEETAPAQQEMTMEERSSILPAALISVGAYLLLIGLFTLLFSEGGRVTLQWDSRFWFLALIASAPLLVFGYRLLPKSD